MKVVRRCQINYHIYIHAFSTVHTVPETQVVAPAMISILAPHITNGARTLTNTSQFHRIARTPERRIGKISAKAYDSARMSTHGLLGKADRCKSQKYSEFQHCKVSERNTLAWAQPHRRLLILYTANRADDRSSSYICVFGSTEN